MTVHLSSDPSGVSGEGPFLGGLAVRLGLVTAGNRGICLRNTGHRWLQKRQSEVISSLG